MRFKLNILYHLFRLKWLKFRYGDNLPKLQQKLWKSLEKKLTKSEYYEPFIGKDLREYPVVNKSEFMNNFNAINTVGLRVKLAMNHAKRAESSRDFDGTINGITIGLSSGTSGNRGLFLASEEERARWVAAVLDRVIGFSFKPRKVAFFLRANSKLYSSVESRLLRFSFYDILNPISNYLGQLNKQNPDILIAQPSVLLELAEYVKRNELRIYPKQIVSVAEVLSSSDKQQIEMVFGLRIDQVYQCTEGFLAHTCKEGTLHFNEDFLIIEKHFLDEDTSRFHPVITDLARSSQPVIRYELNDIVHLKKEPCSCGSKMTAIDHIEGRSDDVLEFENRYNKFIRIYPDFVRRAIISASPDIIDYQVIQTSHAELQIFTDQVDFKKAKSKLRELLRHYQIDGVEIKEMREKKHEIGNKLRRVYHERKSIQNRSNGQVPSKEGQLRRN